MPNIVLRSHREEPSVRPIPAVDGPPSPLEPRRRSGAGLVVVVGIAGLALGWLLGSVREPAPEPVTRLGVEAEASGLTEAFPALDSALLAVGTNGSAAMDLALWPPSGPLSIRPLPAAWTAITIEQKPFEAFAAFDSTARYLALAEPVARDGAVTLLAGRVEEVEPVATGVTSYAWHVTAPHALAYIVEQDGGFLEVMRGSPRTVERVGSVEPGAVLLAWADWGFLVRNGGRLSVWPEGPSIQASFLAATPDRVLVSSGGMLIWWDPQSGGTRAVGADRGASAAAFDVAREAILLTHGTGLAEIAADGSVTEIIEWPLVEYADWSTDGRFVVFADRIDVMVLDRDTDEVTPLGLGRAVAVAIRPPGS